MLLTITIRKNPATDLGYLLHKSPFRVHAFEQVFGRSHVFYPEVSSEICTAALLLEVDPIGLVRNRRGPSGEARALEEYVNDRPYAASSFLSVAIARTFGTAMTGRSKERQELADAPQLLETRIAVLPCRGGEDLLRRLFEPLGYEVAAARHPLDEKFPEWGESAYFTVTLKGTVRLSDLLTHLYVLIPVLDDDKHYWVGDAEVEKLLRHGEGWLREHPERELITDRYLKHQKRLAREALGRLIGDEDPTADDVAEVHAREEEAIEKPISLAEQRIGAVIAALRSSDAKRVLDLGCGEGRLLRELLKDKTFTEITGMDVSHRALEMASQRLRLENLPTIQKERIRLLHGSLTYRDKRLAGYDAATVVEVIEHQDPPRLAAFERVLFEFARPRTVVITTPNVEYNVKFETLPAGKMRHKDHRFEWTRAQFQSWANKVAERFSYSIRFLPIGPEDTVVGSPTQMGIFTVQ
ncbi:MAG TPA: 3' terminal RNA ribose 2'-O-methyltransferase Hen1 [Candidatus Baltobacteraceae bacterium]|jgi:3' terminal RNA ribose 2'-O-methyltransferase Hen1|nr:3' terminal RNA ribose 2'-O-methyltransferase Hen1 [Candidatus Baltobacteraceae bacterium]